MFGISLVELLVIILVAVLVIPVRHWPNVAKFLAQCVKFIRGLFLKMSDAGAQLKEQIELEKPIDDIIKNADNDMLNCFSQPTSSRATAGTKADKKK